MWISLLPHFFPPAANASRCKFCSIMINSHTHPPLIQGHIVDSKRNCLPLTFHREVMYLYQFRICVGSPFFPIILEFTDQFLLFGINRDGRLLPAQEVRHSTIDEFKLSVAIW